MAQSVIYNLHCRPTRRSWLFQEAYMSSYMAHVFLHGAVGNLQPTLSTYAAQLVVARNLRARNLRVARNPAMIAVQVVLQVVA